MLIKKLKPLINFLNNFKLINLIVYYISYTKYKSIYVDNNNIIKIYCIQVYVYYYIYIIHNNSIMSM